MCMYCIISVLAFEELQAKVHFLSVCLWEHFYSCFSKRERVF